MRGGPALWIMKHPPSGRNQFLIFGKHFSIFYFKGMYPYFDNKRISDGAQYGTLEKKIKCVPLAFFWGQPH
jgi:hypothetical protein